MKIKRITAKNFKSFENIDLSLKDFNIVIGSNASGKSNLVDIIKFFRDVETWGIDSAISLQGGRDYLLNIMLGRKESLYVSAEIEADDRYGGRIIQNTEDDDENPLAIKFISVLVELEIKFKEKGEGYALTSNKLTFSYDVSRMHKVDDEWEVRESEGKYTISLQGKKKDIEITTDHPDELNIDINDVVPLRFIERRMDNTKPMLGQPFISFLSPYGDEIFRRISVFDFSPKTIKTSSPVVGKITLEEDASNLPVVLKWILKDKKKRERLVSLVSDLLPFVEDMKVAETSDKSLILELKEKYYRKKYIPSAFLSDGTAHAVALTTALYFDNSEIIFFEEPERNMHPALVRKLIDHMKSHSSEKQVLLTTHNTEILRGASPEDVMYISRCSKGFSCIERLDDREDVKVFLSNEIGIDELYANNLLSGS